MTKPIRVATAMMAAVFFLAAVPARPQADDAKSQAKAQDLKTITSVSDSACQMFNKAVAQSDPDLLLSLFLDTAGVVMPDMNSLTGLQELRRRAPLLMAVIGGGKLEMTRSNIRVHDSLDIARDAGYFTLDRKLEDGGNWKFNGYYTLFWKKTEGGIWKIDRAFIGERKR